MNGPDSRYTDEQMVLILKRAAELQVASEDRVHSLEAIQEIARQAGIDPRSVVAAAATLRSGPPAGQLIFGAPSAYRVSRRIKGALKPSDHAAVLAAIHAHMPLIGQATEFANGLEWHSGPADNKTAITLTPEAADTDVRIVGRMGGPKAMLYLGAGLLTLVTGILGAIASPIGGLELGLATLALSFPAARGIWNHVATRQHARAEHLLNALTEQIGSGDGDTASVPASGGPLPLEQSAPTPSLFHGHP